MTDFNDQTQNGKQKDLSEKPGDEQPQDSGEGETTTKGQQAQTNDNGNRKMHSQIPLKRKKTYVFPPVTEGNVQYEHQHGNPYNGSDHDA